MALLITGILAWASKLKPAAIAFFIAGLVYLLGCFAVTASVNVPMNEGLATIILPQPQSTAAQLWSEYSSRWQLFNQLRAIASALTVLLCAYGIWQLGRDEGLSGL